LHKYPYTLRRALKLAKKNPQIVNEVLGEKLAEKYLRDIKKAQIVFFNKTMKIIIIEI